MWCDFLGTHHPPTVQVGSVLRRGQVDNEVPFAAPPRQAISAAARPRRRLRHGHHDVPCPGSPRRPAGTPGPPTCPSTPRRWSRPASPARGRSSSIPPATRWWSPPTAPSRGVRRPRSPRRPAPTEALAQSSALQAHSPSCWGPATASTAAGSAARSASTWCRGARSTSSRPAAGPSRRRPGGRVRTTRRLIGPPVAPRKPKDNKALVRYDNTSLSPPGSAPRRRVGRRERHARR